MILTISEIFNYDVPFDLQCLVELRMVSTTCPHIVE